MINNIDIPISSRETYLRSDEIYASTLDNTEAIKDRKNFIHNLGLLISQTKEGITSIELNSLNIVKIKYYNGCIRCVDISDENYIDIIRNVVKKICMKEVCV